MSRKQLLYGLVLVAVVALGAASYLLYSGRSGTETVLRTSSKFGFTITPADHTLGSPNAPVQVVEYAAPSCPYCAHWDIHVFPDFKRTYIDTGKVFYVFRVFPLRALDVAVEAMARCLPKKNYFQFINMMYHNQDKWDPDGYNIPDIHAALLNMGRAAGLSGNQVDSCISNKAELKKIADVGAQAGKAYGINSTPSFFIDGKFHQRDIVTWKGLQDVLNAELKKAPKQS